MSLLQKPCGCLVFHEVQTTGQGTGPQSVAPASMAWETLRNANSPPAPRTQRPWEQGWSLRITSTRAPGPLSSVTSANKMRVRQGVCRRLSGDRAEGFTVMTVIAEMPAEGLPWGRPCRGTRFTQGEAEAQRREVTEPVLWQPPVSDGRANSSCFSCSARVWSAEPLWPVHPPAGQWGPLCSLWVLAQGPRPPVLPAWQTGSTADKAQPHGEGLQVSKQKPERRASAGTAWGPL